jgi:hypothetical protein
VATSNWRKISDAPRGIGPLLLRSLLAAAAFALTASIVPANAQSPQPVYGNFSAGSNYVAVSGGTIGVPCCSVSPTIQFVPLLGVNQGGTGLQNLPQNSLLVGQADGLTGPMQAISPGSGGVLIDQGPGKIPAFKNIYGAININPAGFATLTGASGISGCLTIQSYGGAGDNATDNAPPPRSALTALSANGGCVYFSPGNYKFFSRVSVTVGSAPSSFKMIGSGMNNTILYWPNANGGLQAVLSSPGSNVEFGDFSCTTGQTGGGNCIEVDQSSQLAQLSRSTFYNFDIRGDNNSALEAPITGTSAS